MPRRVPVSARDPTASATSSSRSSHSRTPSLNPQDAQHTVAFYYPSANEGPAHNIDLKTPGLDDVAERESTEFESSATAQNDISSVTTPTFRRSASAPSPPPKSALATSLFRSRGSIPDTGQSKQARFDDDVVFADTHLRRTLSEPTQERRKSAPAKILSNLGFLFEDSSSSDEDSDEGDEEVEAALGIFEEVVEELIQVAEEHEEARDILAEVA